MLKLNLIFHVIDWLRPQLVVASLYVNHMLYLWEFTEQYHIEFYLYLLRQSLKFLSYYHRYPLAMSFLKNKIFYSIRTFKTTCRLKGYRFVILPFYRTFLQFPRHILGIHDMRAVWIKKDIFLGIVPSNLLYNRFWLEDRVLQFLFILVSDTQSDPMVAYEKL